MAQPKDITGIEIDPHLVGAVVTEQVKKIIRMFCFYTNGEAGAYELPADENRDSLRHFFTELNMQEICSSMVVDAVVRGRFYVRSGDQCWHYTVLASPDSALPKHVNFYSLPWTLYWQSQEADILEAGNPGDSIHYFAIRTPVAENDTSRLLKGSKTLVHPVLRRKKPLFGRLFLGIGVGLACLVLPIALTMFYAFKPNANASTQPAPAVVVKAAAPQAPAAGSFYLLSNHRITGPFPAKAVATMKAGGQLPADTMCRAENSTDWAGINTLFPSVASK